mmetsp:Transcript_9807/g.24234  ORF Transcript_9807/g.24234 Transcript_9807/m.24234 type:complete len:249 (+) Transcript_9807:710-1456(+)
MRPSGDAPSHSSASSGDNTRNITCDTSAPVRCVYAANASSSFPEPQAVASLPANGVPIPNFSSQSSLRLPNQKPRALPKALAVRRVARSACHASLPCSSPARLYSPPASGVFTTTSWSKLSPIPALNGSRVTCKMFSLPPAVTTVAVAATMAVAATVASATPVTYSPVATAAAAPSAGGGAGGGGGDNGNAATAATAATSMRCLKSCANANSQLSLPCTTPLPPLVLSCGDGGCGGCGGCGGRGRALE